MAKGLNAEEFEKAVKRIVKEQVNNLEELTQDAARYRLVRDKFGCEVTRGAGRLREKDLDKALDSILERENGSI